MTATIGHRFPETEFYLDPCRVEEFELALGIEPEPNWTPQAGASVPPGFFMYVTTYGAEPVHEVLGFDPMRTLYGGTAVEYFRPVHVGDRLTVRPHISDVRIKDGRSGRLTFVDITTEYFTADGQLAVRERSTILERGA